MTVAETIDGGGGSYFSLRTLETCFAEAAVDASTNAGSIKILSLLDFFVVGFCCVVALCVDESEDVFNTCYWCT